MCGLAGYVRLRPGGEPADPDDTLRRAAGLLGHRGPDGEGFYLDPEHRVGLAHRRLAVIDLEGGVQPMSSETGDVHLVLNGEIYDFERQRRELEARGHRFRTRCDAEVALHLYEEHGPACVERLRGMFALAVWDGPRRRLLLARDRLGQKPLAFSLGGDRLAFASELPALRVLADSGGGLDEEALALYLAFGYVPPPRTIEPGLERLRPGERLLVEDGEVRRETYWRLPDAVPLAGSEEELADRFEERLREAVLLRTVADVPLGAFLSGGLDSLAVVTFLAEAGGRVRTLTVRSPLPEHDESAAARRVAEHLGTEHVEIPPEDIGVEDILAVLRAFGEPFGDSSAVPTWAISRAARRHVTVALTGDGGDELLAGYHRHRYGLLLDRLSRWPVGPARGLPGRVGRAARLAAEPAWRRYFEMYDVLNRGWRERVLEAGFAARAKETARTFLRETYDGVTAADPLDRMLRTDLATWLPDDLCVKVDIASMAHGLECRSPFLDHRLVETAVRIPSSLKLRGRTHKRILRRVLGRRLPRDLLPTEKRGFAAPVESWLRGSLRTLLRERLLEGPLGDLGLFRREGLERMIREHESGRANHRIRLWVLLALAEWLAAREGAAA
jgi:asparagine synthase (glutamine-hydrolysing)